MKIAIFGASGYIGLRLAHILNKNKEIEELRLFNRNKRKVLHLINEKTSAFDYEITLKNKDRLKEDLSDVDVVYYLIHSMYEKNNFSEVDNQLATIVSKSAKSAGVKKIIYLGGLGIEDDLEYKIDGFKKKGLSKHLSSRQETADYLRENHNNVIEFRAGVIIGGGSSSFEIIRTLGLKLPFVPKLWKNEGLVEPIFVDNVISYLLMAKENPDFDNKIMEIGCGQTIEYTEIVKMYAKIKKRKLFNIYLYPFEKIITDNILGRVISFMTSLPPALVTPLLGGVKNKAISRDYKIEDVLGYCPLKLISLEKALTIASKREESEHVQSVWDLPSSLSKVNKIKHKRNGMPFSTASKTINGMMFEEEFVEIDELKALYRTDFHSEKTNITINSCIKTQIFQEVKKIGGKKGYWSPKIMWKSRAMIDKLIGGMGFRQFRRDCNELRSGDRVDFWTVEKIVEKDNYKELRLRAEMKLPGEAWLRFVIKKEKTTNKEVFKLQALFDPDGISGYLYWYSLFFIHKYIFKTMLKNIVLNSLKNKKYDFELKNGFCDLKKQ
jgi:uncharacterized protein YbjT (DUF2867 family)